MNLETAFALLDKHSQGLASDSFITFLLERQLSGNGSLQRLEEINHEMMTALEVVNQARRTDGRVLSELRLLQAIAIMLNERWDRYVWWSTHDHNSTELLDRLPEILSNWGFAWARILDGSSHNLKKAVDERGT